MRKLPATIACLALLAAWPPNPGHAQVTAILSSGIAQYGQAFDGFQEAVRERKGALPIVAHNLEKEGGIGSDKPRLVFAVGPEAVKFVRERVKTVPVVAMVLRPQPLAAANIAWVSLEIPVRVKLEKIRNMLPNVTRIGVVYSAASAPLYREAVQGCKALGLQAVGREVDSGMELPEAFKEIAPRIDLFLMLPDTKVFFQKSIEYLLVEGMKNRVPVVGLAASYTRAGALISFEADYRDLGRQAGEIAVRIIGGERPANIEPARPRRVRTSLNLAVAEREGVRIDPQAIKEASDVFR